MSATPTSVTFMSAALSAAVTVSMIGGVSKLKGMDLGEEILHMGIHRGVGLIGGSKFGGVLCGCGCVFVLVDFEARHHLIHYGIGIVEAQLVNCSFGFSEFKVSFTEVVFKIFPCFVRLVGAFPCPDVVFEDLLPVEDNEGEVYCLDLNKFSFGRSCVMVLKMTSIGWAKS